MSWSFYLAALMRLAFPPGQLPAETIIHDLTGEQREILTTFQKYDLHDLDRRFSRDLRKFPGLDLRSPAEFLEFMAGTRTARNENSSVPDTPDDLDSLPF